MVAYVRRCIDGCRPHRCCRGITGLMLGIPAIVMIPADLPQRLHCQHPLRASAIKRQTLSSLLAVGSIFDADHPPKGVTIPRRSTPQLCSKPACMRSSAANSPSARVVVTRSSIFRIGSRGGLKPQVSTSTHTGDSAGALINTALGVIDVQVKAVVREVRIADIQDQGVRPFRRPRGD